MANNGHGQGPNLLHDPVDFLAEVDELSDLVLPEEAVVVLRQLVDQLLPLLHQHVDAEQRRHLKGASSNFIPNCMDYAGIKAEIIQPLSLTVTLIIDTLKPKVISL